MVRIHYIGERIGEEPGKQKILIGTEYMLRYLDEKCHNVMKSASNRIWRVEVGERGDNVLTIGNW